MRTIADDDDLLRLRRAGTGLIYNDFSGTGASGGSYNVLHLATCRQLARANTHVAKLHFDSLEEAILWLEGHRGPEGRNWKRCDTCGADT